LSCKSYKAELAKITKILLILAILKFKLHWIVVKQQPSSTINLPSTTLQTSLEKGKKDKGDLFYIYLSVSQIPVPI